MLGRTDAGRAVPIQRDVMSEPTDLSADAFAPDDGAGMSDTELRALLAQARETGNEPLRRLLASYVTLRRLAAEMITLVEMREGAVTVVRTPLFQRIRHLTRRTSV
jgi:hypothetical protein